MKTSISAIYLLTLLVSTSAAYAAEKVALPEKQSAQLNFNSMIEETSAERRAIAKKMQNSFDAKESDADVIKFVDQELHHRNAPATAASELPE